MARIQAVIIHYIKTHHFWSKMKAAVKTKIAKRTKVEIMLQATDSYLY